MALALLLCMICGVLGLRADFNPTNPPEPGGFRLTAAASPVEGGSVSVSSATVAYGASAYVYASARSGYTFEGWYDASGQKVSASTNYNFTMPANNMHFTAKFIYTPANPNEPTQPAKTVMVTLSAQPYGGGSVSGGGRYAVGSSVYMSASVAAGYQFVRWEADGETVSTSKYFYYTVPDHDVKLTAVYKYSPSSPSEPVAENKRKLRVRVIPPVAATVSPSGVVKVQPGTQQKLHCYPVAGYEFLRWEDASGNTLSTSSMYWYTMPEANGPDEEVLLTAVLRYNPSAPSEPSAPAPRRNVLYGSRDNVVPGQAYNFTINLDNVDTPYGVAVDVAIPEGITADFDRAAVAQRASSQSLQVTKLGDSQWRLELNGTEPISGASGALLRIPMRLEAGNEPGETLAVSLSKGVITYADGSRKSTDAVDGKTKAIAAPDEVPDSPDFRFSKLDVEQSALNPGDILTLSWEVENAGNIAAPGGWSESVYMVDASGTMAPLGTLYYDTDKEADGELKAGAKVMRQATLKVPETPGVDGPLNIYVVLTPSVLSGELDELQANNSRSTADFPINLSKHLTLSGPETMTEGTDRTGRMLLTRSGRRAQAETFGITASAGGRLTVPETVTLPAGQASGWFQVTLNDNTLYEAPVSVQVAASGNGYGEVSHTIQVFDDDFSAIRLDVSADEVEEGGSMSLMLDLPYAQENEVAVSLATSNPSRVTLPASVVFAPGETHAEVEVATVADGQITGDAEITIKAYAERYLDGETFFTLEDTDIPAIDLQISPAEISESAGPAAMRAVLTRSNHPESKATVKLEDNMPGQLSYNTRSIVMQPGETKVEFPIGVSDNAIVDGDREVEITASVYISSCSCTSSGKRGDVVKRTVKIIDDDGPAIKLFATSSTLAEGDPNGVVLRVSRNTSREVPLTVRLSCDAPDKVEMPSEVTIPVGMDMASVRVTAPSNDTEDDGQTLAFTAEAEGFAKGSCWVMLTDRTLADAVITAISLPEECAYATPFEVTVTVENRGVLPLPELLPVSLYAGNTLIGKMYLQEQLLPGATIALTKTVRVAINPGKGTMYAVVNEDKEVQELTYANNRSETVDFTIRSPYDITMESEAETVAAGKCISLKGKVTSAGNASDTAGKDVEVYVKSGNAVYAAGNAVTDAQGNFSFEFTAPAGMFGEIRAGARFPGDSGTPELCSFDVVGLKTNAGAGVFSKGTVDMEDVQAFKVSNPSRHDISGLTATVDGLPEGVKVKVEMPHAIAAGTETEVKVSFISSRATEGSDWERMTLRISNDAGVDTGVSLYSYARVATGELTPDVKAINMNLTWGTVTEFPITITNTGLGETGTVTLSLPSWMQSATALSLPALAPGESAQVVLKLQPTDDMHLNIEFKGQLAINCSNGKGVAIPYTVTPVSTDTGTVAVRVCDEYTYNTAEAPLVSGAKVQVLHPSTLQVIAGGVTDGTEWTAEVPAGYYRVEVTADKHEPYAENVFLSPGETTRVTADISYNPITVKWEVKETEIEDQYLVETEVVYETDVPMPVVRMILPKSIDGDDMRVGDAVIVPMTFVNEGLITALEVTPKLEESNEEWTFEMLGYEGPFDLPAKQSRTIPVRITRVGEHVANPAQKVQRRGAAGEILEGGGRTMKGCMMHAEETYKVLCGHKLRYNGSAENMALQMCAAASLMVMAGDVLGRLTSWLPSYAIPSPGAGGISSAGSGSGKDNPPAIGKSVTICDPCDAAKMETLVGSFTAFGGGPFGHILKLVNKIRDLYRADHRNVKIVTKRVGSNTSDIVKEVADKTLDGNWGNLAKFAIDVYEVGKPCSEVRPSKPARRAPATASGSPWMAHFEEVSQETLQNLADMEEIGDFFFGGADWIMEIDAEKGAYMGWVTSLPDGAMPSEEEILLHKPSSVSLESAENYARFILLGEEEPELSESLLEAMDRAAEYQEKCEAEGYADPIARYEAEREIYKQKFLDMKQKSVCASITLKFSQSVALTRQAFRGTLTVYNGHASLPMEDVKLNLLVRDSKGNIATSREMEMHVESLDGFTGTEALPGDWTLAADAEGVAEILFIPTKYAAPEKEETYTFGGDLTYIDPFTGLSVTRSLYPVPLTVKPTPELDLTYFLERDIYGDNALTPDIVEPTVPAEFALVVHNRGAGEAKDLKIVTAQPEITENEKGLLVDFAITSSQLNGADKVLTLGGNSTSDFGTLGAGASAYAQWWLECSLLGYFSKYNTTATHLTSFGNPDLSLLGNVEIHVLNHGLTTGYTMETAEGAVPVRGFLCDDITDDEYIPDMMHFSDSREPEEVCQSMAGGYMNGDLTYRVDVTAGDAPWRYFCMPDPTLGKQPVVAVRRITEGEEPVELPADNVWQRSWILEHGKDPVFNPRLMGVIPGGGRAVYEIEFAPRADNVLEVTGFAGVPEEGTVSPEPLAQVTVLLNKELMPDSFTHEALKLYHEGSLRNTSGVVIAGGATPTEYVVDFNGLTAENGYYELAVDATKLTDHEGYPGEGGKKVAWVQFAEGDPSGVSLQGVHRIVCYPLPLGGTLTVGGDFDAPVVVEIMTAEGIAAARWEDVECGMALQLPALQKGVYILRLTATDGTVHTVKTMK